MKKILFLIALTPLSAQAWWFGNYDDCVLENMKEGLSTAGVFAVKQACRSKYPVKVEAEKFDPNPYLGPICTTVDLIEAELDKIKLQPDDSGYSIWNGNDFRVNDLAFNLKYMQGYAEPRTPAEVNKSAGSIDGGTSETTYKYSFPSNITAYTVIKATKQICK